MLWTPSQSKAKKPQMLHETAPSTGTSFALHRYVIIIIVIIIIILALKSV